VAGIEKRRNFVRAKDGFDFCGSKGVARIITLNNFSVRLVSQCAQKTSRVATGRSSALEPKVELGHVLLFALFVRFAPAGGRLCFLRELLSFRLADQRNTHIYSTHLHIQHHVSLFGFDGFG
jgi:hypothetical protein